MIGMNYDEIIDIIVKKTGVSKKEIDKKVDNKLSQLSDLVSREGAAHIVANEMKVKVFEDFIKNIKIKRIVAGMMNVDLVGKVVRVYEVRNFKTDTREGKVGSFLIGDDSGVIRVTLWDTNHIKEIEEGRIAEGVVVRIENAYSKDNNGFPEVHLGNKGRVIVGVDEDVGEVNMNFFRPLKKISELNENENADICGTIVQVFEPKTYDCCSECRRKVSFENGGYTCSVHGKINKKESKVLNFYLDDGGGNIRVAVFGELAGELLKSDNFEQIKDDMMGMQVRISGRVVKNVFGDRIEFNANSFSELNPKEILKGMASQVEA
ncbi:MAG: DUF2240 family protein [Nanoarchaeota archaeon]|nr:DUF2240 family protein [Nanoarchaeota archaeon]